jgi:hypothetical protein
MTTGARIDNRWRKDFRALIIELAPADQRARFAYTLRTRVA